MVIVIVSGVDKFTNIIHMKNLEKVGDNYAK